MDLLRTIKEEIDKKVGYQKSMNIFKLVQVLLTFYMEENEKKVLFLLNFLHNYNFQQIVVETLL